MNSYNILQLFYEIILSVTVNFFYYKFFANHNWRI